jgi:Subtilase family
LKDVKYSAGSSYVGADKRYYRTGGTSFSAPFVTGLASLMLSNDPSLSNIQVMNIIKSTARDIDTPGVDQYSGYGIIDARAALKAPKDYFLFAGIQRLEVVKKGNQQVVRVHGIAGANALKSAKLEIGSGADPKQWKSVASVHKSAGPDAVLGDIPAKSFAGSKTWQIRVVVQHMSGATREARFNLNLN